MGAPLVSTRRMNGKSGSSSGGRGSRLPKGEPMNQVLLVDLEELYTGSKRTIHVTRTRNCVKCHGLGTNTNQTNCVRCSKCRGFGMIHHSKQIVPGFVTQVQSICQNCHGSGQEIDARTICQNCGGKRTVSENKTLTVEIEPGMSNGQTLVFENEADERPGIIPGDVHVVLRQQKPHHTFKRDDKYNLVMKKRISLLEALTGFEFLLKHLDGRKLLIRSEIGQVVKPGQIKRVRNEGMLMFRNSQQRGDLLIVFDVKFPTTIPLDTVAHLSSLISARDNSNRSIGKRDTSVADKKPIDQVSDNSISAESSIDPDEYYLEDAVFSQTRGR